MTVGIILDEWDSSQILVLDQKCIALLDKSIIWVDDFVNDLVLTVG